MVATSILINISVFSKMAHFRDLAQVKCLIFSSYNFKYFISESLEVRYCLKAKNPPSR